MDRVLSMISMAMKAGKVVSGEFSTEKAVKSFNTNLVILATDASDNTYKKFSNMCEFYECNLVQYSTKDELGHAIGKEFRASLAIIDDNFADSILKKINSSEI